MDISQNIAALRMQNQHLLFPDFLTCENVVSYFGAIQAQDFSASKWSIGLRMQSGNEDEVEKAYNEGRILRTHVMRPTWHFVMPEDIRWMLDLTAPQVKKLQSSYDRKLELSETLLSSCRNLFIKALEGGKQLTRDELAQQLEQNHIPARGQRLGHIMVHLELDSLICSGPRIGKQFTYMLLEDRVKIAKKLERSEALAKLALKYFLSHGPAQLKDFSWWSGLSVKDSMEGLDLIKSRLEKEEINNKTYWFSGSINSVQMTDAALLLSIYDEYTIAYKDRSDISGNRDIEKMISMGNALTAVIIINGKVAGNWKKSLKKNSIEIILCPFKELNPTERAMLETEIKRYGDFLGISAVLKNASCS